MIPIQVFLFIMISIIPFVGLAHGELDERIDAVTEELKQSPNSITLLLKRAKLYHQHDEHMRAIRDYEKAENLGGSQKIILQGYAEAWLQLEQPEFGLESINQLIVLAPDYHRAYQIKAQLFMSQQKYQEAIPEYRKTIDLTREKHTPLYHDLITAYDSIGTHEAKVANILIIQEALHELGSLITLEHKMIDLLSETQQYDAAIAKLTEVISYSNRKERHYLKRAKLYMRLNNPTLAQRDLLNSLASIEALAIRTRQSRSMIALKTEIENLQN